MTGWTVAALLYALGAGVTWSSGRTFSRGSSPIASAVISVTWPIGALVVIVGAMLIQRRRPASWYEP